MRIQFTHIFYLKLKFLETFARILNYKVKLAFSRNDYQYDGLFVLILKYAII